MQKRTRTVRPVVAALGLIAIVTVITAGPVSTPVVATPAAAGERTFSITPPPRPPESLTRALEELLRECPGEPAVVIRLPDERWSIGHGEDRVVKAASVIKLPILVAVLRLVEREGIDLEEAIPVLAADRTRGSGRLKSLRRIGTRRLEELLRLMIAVSDNTATNAVIRHFGRATIDAEFEAMGLVETRLNHLILRSPEDNPTTARETADLIERLHRNDDDRLLEDPALRALALSFMEKVAGGRRLGRYLPEDSRLHHKTGTLRSVVHDAGLFRTARGEVLVAALVSGANDWTAAEAWIARLGRAVHESLSEDEPAR